VQLVRVLPALDRLRRSSLSASTTCRFTRPRPTRSAVSSDSMTRARSALPSAGGPAPLPACRRAVRGCACSPAIRAVADLGLLEVLRYRDGKQMYTRGSPAAAARCVASA
jgi:hypothetical protein